MSLALSSVTVHRLWNCLSVWIKDKIAFSKSNFRFKQIDWKKSGQATAIRHQAECLYWTRIHGFDRIGGYVAAWCRYGIVSIDAFIINYVGEKFRSTQNLNVNDDVLLRMQFRKWVNLLWPTNKSNGSGNPRKRFRQQSLFDVLEGKRIYFVSPKTQDEVTSNRSWH